MPQRTGYIEKAMESARYEQLPSGEYYGEIRACKGVWASAKTTKQCKIELREVLEDWLLLKLRDGDPIPAVGRTRLLVNA